MSKCDRRVDELNKLLWESITGFWELRILNCSFTLGCPTMQRMRALKTIFNEVFACLASAPRSVGKCYSVFIFSGVDVAVGDRKKALSHNWLPIQYVRMS